MYEKQSRNTNRSSDTIASFLLKTYEILEHPEYERMISWDKSNVGFIINDVVSFTREILPKYFRHSNFSSFVRQLNMYDFHKVKQENQSLVFKNPLFCKGEQQNLKFIRRKAAKKVGGQRKQNMSDRNDAENEKYENLLKGFKKSFQTEINHSSFFYERSIQLMKDLNESSLKKKAYIGGLYIREEQHETEGEDGRVKAEEKEDKVAPILAEQQESKPIKDTVIQIPREFISPSEQIGPQKQNKQNTDQQPPPHISRKLNIDRVMQLKEEVYKSLEVYQSWLQDYIEINKKKIKYISSSRQQLVKCRENRNSENHENQENIHYGGENDQQKNDENEQNLEEQKPISLQEINQRQENNRTEIKLERGSYSPFLKQQISNLKIENNGAVLMKSEVKNVLPIRLFEPSKSVQKPIQKSNGMSPFQQTGFVPMNDSFSSRLFSTFMKPKEEKSYVKENKQRLFYQQENYQNSHVEGVKQEGSGENQQ